MIDIISRYRVPGRKTNKKSKQVEIEEGKGALHPKLCVTTLSSTPRHGRKLLTIRPSSVIVQILFFAVMRELSKVKISYSTMSRTLERMVCGKELWRTGGIMLLRTRYLADVAGPIDAEQ